MYGDEAPGGFSPEGLAQVRTALQGVVDAGSLAGVVTLLWRKGEVAQVNTVGYRDLAAKAPMTRDTLFRIASMTKPVTSVAALMLMEEGKLKLEDPVTKWLPELKDMLVLEDATGPLDKTYPAAREITVEDLFTHRAGLAYAFTSQGPIAHAHEKALGSPLGTPLTPDEWLAALGTLPLSYPPGERLHYSHATEVLGFLVARIEGKPLGQVLKERIFDPLGMTDTSFWLEPGKRVRQGQVIGFVGSTGQSTGAHVHYEILVNGRFVDPMRIKLPRGRSLDGPLLASFEKERDRLDAQMNNRSSARVSDAAGTAGVRQVTNR